MSIKHKSGKSRTVQKVNPQTVDYQPQFQLGSRDLNEGGSVYDTTKFIDQTIDDQLLNLEEKGLAHQTPAEGQTHGSGFPLSLHAVQQTRNDKPQRSNQKPTVAAANYGIMQRVPLDLDQSAHFTDKSMTRSARDNMKSYMKNFGIEFLIPALFVQDALIYPVDPVYSIQLINYVFPVSDEFSVSTHNLDGSSSIGTFRELFSQYTRGVVLRLLKREKSSLSKVGEIALNAQRALMEFHHDGEMFAFFFQDTQILKITYIDEIENFVDMLRTLEDEKHDDNYFVDYRAEEYGQDLSFIEHIKFDIGKKFIIGWGGTQIFMLNMELNTGEIHQVNPRLYSEIHHVNFISSDEVQDYNFSCYVAAQRKEVNQIVVFDLDEELALREEYGTMFHGEKLQTMMTLNYLEDLNPHFKLVVSHDNKQVLFTNGLENSVLEVMDGYYNQRKLKHLKNKIVRHIQQDYKDGGFYMLACQEYDKNLSVEHTNRDSFDIRFQRLIEPNTIRIFDFHILTSKRQKGRGAQKEIRVVSMIDDEFILDKCEYEEVPKPGSKQEPRTFSHLTLDKRYGDAIPGQLQKQLTSLREEIEYIQQNDEYVFFIFSPLRAYSVQWPYVALSGLANFVLIVNAYDRKVLRRIQIAERDAKITINETFITETMDLFVVIQDEEYYRLFHIDLDASNEFEQNPDTFRGENQYQFNQILAYKALDVGSQPLKQIHVRGSSKKDDDFDMNQKLQVLFLHGNDLYGWVQTHEKDDNINQEIKFVTKCTSKMFKDKDETVYFMHFEKNMDTKKATVQVIKQLNCLFSTFEVIDIYKEPGQSEKLKTMNLDPESDKMIIFSRKSDDRGASLQRKNIFRILDYKSMKVIHESVITSPELIGRLKTGLYTYSNGHIYFNNNCIKIRYDLLESRRGEMLYEDDVLDYYMNCFDLQENEKIRAGTPFDSQKNHRFVYIKSDLTRQQPTKILILPYLHERRIYMNTKKLAQNYFYTSIITTSKQEKAYMEAYNETKRKGGKAEDIRVLDVLKKVEDDAGSEGFLQRKKSFLDIPDITNLSQSSSSKEKQAQFISIICMKTTNSKYYVYSQNGTLINRIEFKNLTDVYGMPLQTSANGQVYILKKTQEQLEDMAEQNASVQDQATEFCSFSIVKITPFGMQYVKSINLQLQISEYLKEYMSGSYQAKFHEENQWFMNNNFEYLTENVKFSIMVNDQMDVLVRINYKPEDPNQELQKPQVSNSIYYYESIEKVPKGHAPQNGIFGSQDPSRLVGFMSKPQTKKTKFIFNQKYLFMWNLNQIEYLELGEKFEESNMKKLSFSISENQDMNEQAKIKDIRCGSNPQNIVIIVRQKIANRKIDTIIQWNMSTDLEEESYEIHESYLLLWGSAGNPYIITENKTFFIKQRCAITAFDYQGIIEEFKDRKNKEGMSIHQGHRVDGNNHNWLVFEEYLSLPFSYMTFVIKDKIESEDECMVGNHFDPEPYNYVFNRNTCFTEGEFVTLDHNQLNDVIENLKKISLDHLEIINYTNEINDPEEGKITNSALHRAVYDGNQRSINYIIGAMACIKENSSSNYVSIFKDLIEFQEFFNYFGNLPTQTYIMQEKQTFRSESPVNDMIISQTSKSAIYFTKDFFKDEMGERREDQSFPVDVLALRADWILNTEDGKNFLQGILQSGNLDFFKIETLQMLTEFLFQKFKYVIIFLLMPIYLGAHVSYILLNQYNEPYLQLLAKQYGDNSHNGVSNPQDIGHDQRLMVFISAGLCMFVWLIQLIQVFIFIYQTGKAYFNSLYSWLDIFYLVSIAISLYFLYILHFGPEIEFHDFERNVKTLRIVGVVGYISLYAKASYFLSLVDSIAPLIDIIFKIIADIKWFMVISAIYLAMFSQCYNLISKNQIDFDYLTEEEEKTLPYGTLSSSAWFMIQTFLGGASTTGFGFGDGSQEIVLNVLFFISTFLIITHFLNMLIAIMGNTFGERTEVGAQIMSRDHLRFVIDNWHLLGIAFRDKSKLKYIITAKVSQGDIELTDEEKGAWLIDKLQKLEKNITDKIRINTDLNNDISIVVGETHRIVNPKNNK